MIVQEAIERGTKCWANGVAIVSDGQKFTFREVNERVNRLANGLVNLGVKRGSHIGVILDNCHQYIEIYFAKLKLNAAWVTISPRLSQEELIWQINDAEIDTLLVGKKYLETLDSIRTDIKTVRHYIVVPRSARGFVSYEELVSTSSAEMPKVDVKENDLSRISYTGGTTGRPKGIIITRRSDEALLRNILIDGAPDLNRRDVFLGLQPIFHAVWTYILPCWIKGATQITTHDWSPEAVCETIEKERVTIIKTIPTIIIRLISYPELRNYNLSSLRTIIYGGAPMPVERLKEGIEVFGPIFVGNYGQAEAPMTITTLGKEDHIIEGPREKLDRLYSVGKPYTFVNVKIVDENLNEVPTGEFGEVIVKGDHAMVGYWRQPPEVTAETIKDGWIFTRDIGRFDQEGYLYLVDRKSEMIVSGGLNVYPNEVEQVLCMHPAVLEAAVIGVPDGEWGESIKAFVTVKPGGQVSEQELIAFCRTRIASYKKPKSIDFRDSLPKSNFGKILRRVLREPYWKGHERRNI